MRGRVLFYFKMVISVLGVRTGERSRERENEIDNTREKESGEKERLRGRARGWENSRRIQGRKVG